MANPYDSTAELANHAAFVAVSAILICGYIVQLTYTCKRKRLSHIIENIERKIPRETRVSFLKQFHKYQKVPRHIRASQVAGSIVVILLAVRSADPLGSFFFDPAWLRLLSFNTSAAVLVLACIHMDNLLQLSRVLQRKGRSFCDRWYFYVTAVIPVAAANGCFVVYIMIDVDSSKYAHAGFLFSLVITELLMLLAWNKVYFSILKEVRTTRQLRMLFYTLNSQSPRGSLSLLSAPDTLSLSQHNLISSAGSSGLITPPTASAQSHNVEFSLSPPRDSVLLQPGSGLSTPPSEATGPPPAFLHRLSSGTSSPIAPLAHPHVQTRHAIDHGVWRLHVLSAFSNLILLITMAVQMGDGISTMAGVGPYQSNVRGYSFPSAMYFVYLQIAVVTMLLYHGWQPHSFRFVFCQSIALDVSELTMSAGSSKQTPFEQSRLASIQFSTKMSDVDPAV